MDFKITSQWSGAFNANVTVKNTSDKVIDNWAIGFKLDNEITNIWNGQVYSNENGIYVIKNTGYNQDIGIGQSISFGFTAKSEAESEVMMPNSYYMVTKEAVVDNIDFTVTYNVTKDWGTGYNGEIIITNNSQSTIEDWYLQFDFLNNIDRFWTANIIGVQSLLDMDIHSQ